MLLIFLIRYFPFSRLIMMLLAGAAVFFSTAAYSGGIASGTASVYGSDHPRHVGGRDIFGNPVGKDIQGNPNDKNSQGVRPKDAQGNPPEDIYGNKTGSEPK